MDFDKLIPLIEHGGVITVLLVFVVGLNRGWFVTGREYVSKCRDCDKAWGERDEWKAYTLRLLEKAEYGADLAQRGAEIAQKALTNDDRKRKP